MSRQSEIRDSWGGCAACYDGEHGRIENGVCVCCHRRVEPKPETGAALDIV